MSLKFSVTLRRRKETARVGVVLWVTAFVLSAPGNRAAQAESQAHRACRVVETNFEGWKAVRMTNAWVGITIVPQLGGRVMQIEFAGHPYLFINPQYKGKYFPPVEGEAKGKWFNYGGDKIWPMPEGNQDEQHWPGPIADALDDGGYTPTILSQGTQCRVRLDGPADERTGLQYSREIVLGAESPEISFHAVMRNSSARSIQWSMQSVTQYDLADREKSSAYNRNFWAYTPANPSSAYLDGFHVRSGLADDPSFSAQNGLFTLHWMYLQNEVWIDSPGDWLAVVDRTSRFAMIERFTVYPGANYPGKATVIFYKNGPAVEMDARGMPAIRISSEDAPFYMEAEINCPIVSLHPGETYAMDTQWFPTRTADNFQSVNAAGLVATPLLAAAAGENIHVTGTFGVFFPGKLEARLFDSTGRPLAAPSLGAVQPEELVTLDQEIAQASATRIELHVIDDNGRDRGLLAAAALKLEVRGP
jgi:hypothetical protein